MQLYRRVRGEPERAPTENVRQSESLHDRIYLAKGAKKGDYEGKCDVYNDAEKRQSS